MTTPTLTTELEAINTMLDGIGESPITSLEVSGLVEVAKAKALLNEVSIAVQTTGWHFNSEQKYPLVRDLDGYITIPQNVLQVDTAEEQGDIDVTQRGTRLYDKKNHTYVFTKDLSVDIVFYLPWDELPQAARRYIMIRAARVFQTRELGSDVLHSFSDADESLAWADLKSAEGSTGDYNMFNGSWSVASILDR
jgi:hypothetical protein